MLYNVLFIIAQNIPEHLVFAFRKRLDRNDNSVTVYSVSFQIKNKRHPIDRLLINFS